MISVSSLFPRALRRSARAQARLQAAYEHLFTGNGGVEDAEIVLADLAKVSGYYHTCSPDVSTAELRCREGKRGLFARVLTFLNLPNEARDALQAAVMREIEADQTNGTEI